MANEPLQKVSFELLRALDAIKSKRVYPRGGLLFECGRPAIGIYLIERGEVKILLPGGVRPEKPFEVAGPGAVLGLSETIAGADYKLTAEAVNRTTAAYVDRQQFMDILHEHCGICMQIVRLLSEDLHGLYYSLRFMDASPVRRRKKALPKAN